MLCIWLKNTNPCFCLAAEEFLLKNYSEDIFMLWQSADTVVVGKHQNAMGEINYRHVRENGIKVARRISGGGTVYHDMGNVNFTFIKNVSGPQEISFKRFMQPMIDVLATMGVKAETSGRNDILINSLKISGNAEHIFKNRVLHHGTLLYNSNLQNLGDAIRVKEGKYESKAVQSKRSKVANISEFLSNPPPIDEFIQQVFRYKLSLKNGNREFLLSDTENAIIGQLSKEKFETREWQFGYSPSYRFSTSDNRKGKHLILILEVEKGIIRSIKIDGEAYNLASRQKLLSHIPGTFHDFESIAGVHKLAGIPGDDELIYLWF